MKKTNTPNRVRSSELGRRLVRKLQYLQKKARAHELQAASNGHYKVAIMQRAAWDTLREVQEVIHQMKSAKNENRKTN